MFDYPVVLEAQPEGGFVVTFPDVPEAITQGDDEDEALLYAADALETVRPIFEVMGKIITHVGDSGSGQVAKAANQIMVAAQMVAMGELLVLAQKSGAAPVKVIQAIRGGAAQCWTLDVKPPRLFAGNRQPGFKARMQAKDLNIVLDTAREYGVALPATAVNSQLFNAMSTLGMGDLDNSAVIAILEQLANIRLQEEKTE